jgi:hypothetical protein
VHSRGLQHGITEKPGKSILQELIVIRNAHAVARRALRIFQYCETGEFGALNR